MTTTLTASAPRARHTIVNRMTRYAIECRIDGIVTIIGYTLRASKMSLLRAAREQAAAILPFITETDKCTYRAGVLTLGTRVNLRCGDTERRTQEGQ